MFFLSLLCVAASLARSHAGPTPSIGYGADISAFEVHSLPEVHFDVPRSYAGEIPIPGKSDDNLFFWLFESENAAQSNELIIWLNGGPGCSSMTGVALENGPFVFPNSTTPSKNPFSWTKLANVLYIDQPVGAGYSFGSDAADNNNEVTDDFFYWLQAFYKIFPDLKAKRTFLAGESYAGTYIPYFTDRLLKSQGELAINLQGISIGDPTIGNYAAAFDVGISTFLHQSNSILEIPEDILQTFTEADKKCGFDKVLAQASYPPQGPISIPGNPEGENFRRTKRQSDASTPCDIAPTTSALIKQSINGACYGSCATFSTAADYLLAVKPCFNDYNIDYTCTTTPDSVDPVNWFNRPDVRKVIHAENKTFEACNTTILDTLGSELVTPPTYSILPCILNQLPVHIYSGSYVRLPHNHSSPSLFTLLTIEIAGFHAQSYRY
ncbi:MAG: hypothetical protein M4579_001210 [Chaenotheca gracillima]|nr:MAG: hypothetical protein M4579_001210 [Chaenotheca gracillima]